MAERHLLVQVVHTRVDDTFIGVRMATFSGRDPAGCERCSRPARGVLTIDEGHRLRLALRLAGVTQARAAKVLDARQTQLSAWMATGKGPDGVVPRLEAAFGFRTDALVDACPRRGGNLLCHGYKPRGSPFCAACAMRVPLPATMPEAGDGDGDGEERLPSCLSCGKSEADQVRLRPARLLSSSGRVPHVSGSAGALFICTQCRNAHRHQLHRCPDCDGWMRAGRDRCHRCALRTGGGDAGAG